MAYKSRLNIIAEVYCLKIKIFIQNLEIWAEKSRSQAWHCIVHF